MENEGEKHKKLKKLLKFLLNPRFLLCFGIAWLITNGWSYVMLGIGTYFGVGWMIGVATAYLTFLWLPISPEKIVTFTIALALLRWLFPDDKETLAVLKEEFQKAKDAFLSRKKKREEKKAAKSAGNETATEKTTRKKT